MEIDKKPRVVLLYRASTKKQTDSDNDIPLQRDILRPWVENNGWEIVDEKVEGGVSGFKVSAKNRDAIIEIKAMAERGEFDILGIYMSDRLGRIAEETPLIVSFLNSKGIKVVSYSEGEITANTHADKLMTYIRYWQAEGESLKTSARVTDAGEASVRAGKWRGGNPPYGYHSVSRGTLNYKGKPIFDIEIHPEQAEIVRTVFKMYTEQHYGCTGIAKYLNNNGYTTSSGNLWNGSLIIKMLKNKMYMGIYELGKWTKNRPIVASPVMENMVIIDAETFEKAQKIRVANNLNPEGKKRQTVHGKLLLTGMLYCGECGQKFTSLYHCYKRPRKDGSIWEHEVYRYRCMSSYTPVNRKETCHQRTFRQELLDGMVITDAKKFVQTVDRKKLLDAAELTLNEQLKAVTERLRKLTNEKNRIEKEQEKLKESVLKSIMGEGDYPVEILNEMLVSKTTELAKITEKITEVKKIQEEIQEQLAAQKEVVENLDTWEKRFDAAKLEQKKAILLNIIDKIFVYPHGIRIDYKIETRCFGFGALKVIDQPDWVAPLIENEKLSNKQNTCEKDPKKTQNKENKRTSTPLCADGDVSKTMQETQ